ncbi:two-component system OmpR family sensor kinase [Microbacterium resistens]|uniref:histidine kinase n=1 Tax=Microbacterium resistens TaxID=156977 RepID=A0ABU1S7V4_9MICO|nr:ATP-binding protein [Microbacterium resistens]MDR6865675.1 two-component system OmpR family sensor kinase [Microbacterium resistens]
MTAVIGIVSLILVTVAIVTSVFLGRALEDGLAGQLRTYGDRLQQTATVLHGISAETPTAVEILSGTAVPPGLMLIVIPTDGSSPNGFIVNANGHGTTVDQNQMLAAVQQINSAESVVDLDSLGSYQLVHKQVSNSRSIASNAATTPFTLIVGLPRTDIQRTLSSLFTVIALATAGGLILLGVTTAVTVRVSLRPLRAVAATATRVANQPLDRGDVSIQERVPPAEADPRTETGLVGAALNTLLDHVDTSLAARQRNEERMRQFVADASHELRTPLASIRGYSELSLRSPELPETAQTALERIQAQSLRMTRLVEDLLLLARLEEGQELIHTPVDLTRLAIEGVEDARPTAHDHLWEIDVPAEPVMVLGDAGRLQQVIANLLANARTHTPEGTRITIELGVDGPSALLRVRDDGPGIDAAVRDDLFARFARGDRSRTRATGGTGLGLAITKAIVEGHSGTIAVESEPGSTVFEVRLPRYRAETADDGADTTGTSDGTDTSDTGDATDTTDTGDAMRPGADGRMPDGASPAQGQHFIDGHPSSDGDPRPGPQ